MIIKKKNDMFIKQRLIIGAISIVFIIVGSMLREYYDKKEFFEFPRLYNEIELNSCVVKITRHDGYQKGYFVIELTNNKSYLIDYKLEGVIKVGSEIFKYPGENKVKIINNENYDYFEFKNSY